MPLSTRKPSHPELPALKAAVRRLLDLSEDVSVMISELSCTEPGCPPLETVIAVLPADGEARRWTVHLPIAQITEDDLRHALTTADEGA